MYDKSCVFNCNHCQKPSRRRFQIMVDDAEPAIEADVAVFSVSAVLSGMSLTCRPTYYPYVPPVVCSSNLMCSTHTLDIAALVDSYYHRLLDGPLQA